MSFNIDLSDKIVVITGVSSGIGAAVAKSYASANAKIAGCALESPEDSNVKCFIEDVKNDSGIPPLYVQADVTCKPDLENFIKGATGAKLSSSMNTLKEFPNTGDLFEIIM